MNPARGHDQFRVQFMVRILQDHLGQLRTGTGMLTRVVSSGPSPDARRSSQSTSSCWLRRTFEQAPPQRASSGSAVGRVERRGEASGACRGSATGSISLLWRPWSPVGCGVRGQPDAIASPGSLQRHPAAGTGMNRRRGCKAPRKDGRAPHARGWTRVRHQDAGHVHRTRGKGWRARPEPPGSASEDCTVRPLGGAISRAPGSEHAERDSPHRHEAIRKPPQTGLDEADFSNTRPTARWSLPADLR